MQKHIILSQICLFYLLFKFNRWISIAFQSFIIDQLTKFKPDTLNHQITNCKKLYLNGNSQKPNQILNSIINQGQKKKFKVTKNPVFQRVHTFNFVKDIKVALAV